MPSRIGELSAPARPGSKHEDRELLFRMELTVLDCGRHQLGGDADGALHGLVAEVGAGG